MRRPLFKYDNSRRRPSRISFLKTVTVKMESSGQNVILVPVLSLCPDSLTEYCGIPILYSCSKVFPSRWTDTYNFLLKALTQLTPTPCKPPETLYESLSNFPPACNTVITTSRALLFSLG